MSEPKVWLGSDGIMRSEYAPDIYVLPEDIKKEYSDRKKIIEEKHPVIIVLHRLVQFYLEAGIFFSSTEYGSITNAAAFIISEYEYYPICTRHFIKTLKKNEHSLFPIAIFANGPAWTLLGQIDLSIVTFPDRISLPDSATVSIEGVPEPSTITLLLLGTLGCGLRSGKRLV